MRLITLVFSILILNAFHVYGETGFANKELVEEVESTHWMRIDEATFIWNIQGYACPVPAINLSRIPWGVDLRHNKFLSFGVTGMGLTISNPNMQFCGMGDTAESIFGEEYQIGVEVTLPIKIQKFTYSQGEKKFLNEYVEAELFGVKISSSATIEIP